MRRTCASVCRPALHAAGRDDGTSNPPLPDLATSSRPRRWRRRHGVELQPGTLPDGVREHQLRRQRRHRDALRAALNAFQQPMKDAEAHAAVHRWSRRRSPSICMPPARRHGALDHHQFAIRAARPGGRLRRQRWQDLLSPGLYNSPPTDGGKYGNWIFTPLGVDIRQGHSAWGLFNAAAPQPRALTVIGGSTVTPDSIDKLVAIFGSSPGFPGFDATPTPPDAFVAVYAKRRDSATLPTPASTPASRNLIRAVAPPVAAPSATQSCSRA